MTISRTCPGTYYDHAFCPIIFDSTLHSFKTELSTFQSSFSQHFEKRENFAPPFGSTGEGMRLANRGCWFGADGHELFELNRRGSVGKVAISLTETQTDIDSHLN
jgi:hypothetical protein